MLDIKFIRQNPDQIKKAAKDKGLDFDLDRLLKIDQDLIKLNSEIEELRHNLKQTKTKPSDSELEKLKQISTKLNIKEKQVKKIEKEFTELILQVPNIPDPSVPIGKSDTANKAIKIWGNPPEFNFVPRDHEALAKKLDIVDFERGVKMSGFRGYFLKNEGVILDLAINRLAMDFIQGRGFDMFSPPVIMNNKYFYGSGWFPAYQEETYRIVDEDSSLIGTSEVPLVAYHSDEILPEESLPKKYAAFSPCFRTEIGSYGKETKGLYRVHQINKVEQVIICKNNPQEARKWLFEIVKNSEELLQSLGLPYRVMHICTGEMGASKIEQFDIETWMPSFAHFRETHSASNLGEFQSRRLKMRYRTSDGKIEYPYTLNNTVIATPRILIPLLENYQNADGSITIPEVLHKYTGFKKIEPKNYD